MPHSSAPRLSKASPDEAQVIIQQLITDISSPNAHLAGELLALTREASLVNLYFWLKFVCSYAGPYDQLNTTLHLDMCNFRQSPACMAPDARFGISTARGFFKSTIGTHGADSWEALRNPNIRIRLVNAITDRAQQFLDIIKNTYSRNELVRLLFPKHYVQNPRSQPNWNIDVMVLPNRTKFYSEPTIKVGASSGSSEGDHHDLTDIDDLIGMDDMNADRTPSADMEKKRNWFRTNRNALPTPHGRVGVKFTRYGPDDVYEDIFQDLKAVEGYPAEWAKTKPNGSWTIYYRMGRENGKATCPELLSDKKIDKLAEEDRWYYLTQIQNSPYDTGMAEFRALETGRGVLERRLYTHEDGSETEELCLVRTDQRDDKPVLWSRCDRVIAIDPAATDRGMLSKVCRTGISFIARDERKRTWLVEAKVGFYSIFETFDVLFAMVSRYEGAVRTCVVEANAFQKVLEPLLEAEREKRGIWVSFQPVASGSEKEARIRGIIGTALSRDEFICCTAAYADFEDEKERFPQSKFRMDLLDSVQLAMSEAIDPISEKEELDDEFYVEELAGERTAVTGY